MKVHLGNPLYNAVKTVVAYFDSNMYGCIGSSGKDGEGETNEALKALQALKEAFENTTLRCCDVSSMEDIECVVNDGIQQTEGFSNVPEVVRKISEASVARALKIAYEPVAEVDFS